MNTSCFFFSTALMMHTATCCVVCVDALLCIISFFIFMGYNIADDIKFPIMGLINVPNTDCSVCEGLRDVHTRLWPLQQAAEHVLCLWWSLIQPLDLRLTGWRGHYIIRAAFRFKLDFLKRWRVLCPRRLYYICETERLNICDLFQILKMSS